MRRNLPKEIPPVNCSYAEWAQWALGYFHRMHERTVSRKMLSGAIIVKKWLELDSTETLTREDMGNFARMIHKAQHCYPSNIWQEMIDRINHWSVDKGFSPLIVIDLEEPWQLGEEWA